MVITSEEHNALLDELVAEYSLGELEPDEVTHIMFAKSSGLSAYRAGEILRQKLENGEITVRWVRDPNSGRKIKAYRKAKQ